MSRISTLDRAGQRALVLLVASGAALLGVLTLVVCWLSLGVGTIDTDTVGAEPCIVAYEAGQGASVVTTAVPPRTVCRWTVDGVEQEILVATAPAGLVAAGLTVAVLGAATVVVVGVTGRRRR